MRRTLPSGRPGAGPVDRSWVERRRGRSRVRRVAVGPVARAFMVQTHRTVRCRNEKREQHNNSITGATNMTKSRFAHTCESCDPSAAADVSIQCCFDSIFSGPSGTKQQTAHAHMQPCPRSLCPTPMHTPHAGSTHAPMPHLAACNPAELDSLCSRDGPDSRCGTEIPSMHVIAASSPGTRSRGDRRRAHIIKTCPFRHPPPTPPHSPARHSPRQPYEPPVGGIHLEVSYLPASACISLHLPASPIADIGASRGAHQGANPRATRRSSRRRMASCPPSDTVLPRRSLRAREEAGAASR